MAASVEQSANLQGLGTAGGCSSLDPIARDKVCVAFEHKASEKDNVEAE